MPSTFTKDWGTTFNAAAVVFSKDINGLMKTDQKGSASLKKLLNDVQSPLGIINALTALDKIELSAGNPKLMAALPANIKLYKAALSNFEAAKSKYFADLGEAAKANVSLYPNNMITPTPLKTAFPDSYRQLKILHTEVESIYAKAQNSLKLAENAGKLQKITDEKEKAKSKVKGHDDAANAKLEAISDEAAMKQFVIGFATSFKAGMAKGAGVIQRIKAKPTLETYNKEMNGGGRDISQNLNNVVKLKSNPDFKKSSFAKKIPDPGSLAAEITPFANGNMRRLPDTATDQDVKKALETFSALHKKIASTYADVLNGKV